MTLNIFVLKSVSFFSTVTPQTPVFDCYLRACGASAPCCSWVCWRVAPPAFMPSARPAAMPAPAAIQPSRKYPWRSSTATPTATRSCSSPAASQPSASSFVWNAVRSAIAARRQQDDLAWGLMWDSLVLEWCWHDEKSPYWPKWDQQSCDQQKLWKKLYIVFCDSWERHNVWNDICFRLAAQWCVVHY